MPTSLKSFVRATYVALALAGLTACADTPGSSAGTSTTPVQKAETPAEMLARANGAYSVGRLETAVSVAKALVQQHAGTPEADSASRLIPVFQKAADDSALAASHRAEHARLAEKWTYTNDTDAMTGRSAHYASIVSENTVDFDFPYSGPQHATLTLRRHPSYGHDVYLQIERGQILCTSYDGCTVRVRFDDGSAEAWSASAPDDNSSETVFIRGYDRFLARLRKAKIVRIQISVYQEGSPVFEFQTEGFDAKRFLGQ